MINTAERYIPRGLIGALTTCTLMVALAPAAGAWESSCTNTFSDNVSKYYVLCKTAKTYLEAREDAERSTVDGEPGYLLHIDDADELRTIERWIFQYGAIQQGDYASTVANDGGGAAYLWLGGDDRQVEGRWEWQRSGVAGYPKRFWQSGTAGGFHNWGTIEGQRNEPDDFEGQDAAAYALEDWPIGGGPLLGEAGQWNDVDEANTLFYVIEFDKPGGDRGTLADSGGSGDNEEPSGTFRVALEEPVEAQIHMGVGNLRGWAVADAGIEKVEIFIDGGYAFDIPYGGYRGDVGGTFPDISGSAQSGFSAAFNYSGLSGGQHTISAVAHTVEGTTRESSATFSVVRFPSEFIGDPNAVNLDDGICRVSGDEISVVDAIVSGEMYDLLLRWRTAEQGFEIVEIR